jgi:hypothetical protein
MLRVIEYGTSNACHGPAQMSMHIYALFLKDHVRMATYW